MKNPRIPIILGLIAITILYVLAIIRYQSLINIHSEATSGWKILEILSTMTYIAAIVIGIYILKKA